MATFREFPGAPPPGPHPHIKVESFESIINLYDHNDMYHCKYFSKSTVLPSADQYEGLKIILFCMGLKNKN